MTTENSVVVALREVRRLEIERQRRDEEAKRREQEEERARTEAASRASIQYGPGLAPYVNGQGWAESNGEVYTNPVRRTTEVVPLAERVYAETQSVPAPPPGWLEDGMAFRQAPRGKSRFGAVLTTLLVCGAAGAAGYWKLSGEWKATVTRLETENQNLEEQRNEAVAARSKAEQEMKVRLAELQTKLTDLATRRTAAENAAAKADDSADPRPGPKAAAAPLAGNRFNRGAFRRGAGAGRGRFPGVVGSVKPPAAMRPINPTVKFGPNSDEPRPAPKVAKKKNLSDDPLGGLRL
jgi:hypothetical protein